VTTQLQRQWLKLGIRLDPEYLSTTELQNSIKFHDYDALLYGIEIGVDPDVFAYWDSSQADIRAAARTNLSEYKNTTADISLEAGRTRINPALRIIKYRPFLQVWQQDNPALGLYQPRYLYITHGMVAGLTDHVINTGTDRFNNVQNWEIRQARVTN
jgi:peptide/nickel transport system substrate-binding protein